jgi:hypothetical protein
MVKNILDAGDMDVSSDKPQNRPIINEPATFTHNVPQGKSPMTAF